MKVDEREWNNATFHVDRRDSSLYNRPEGQKVYSQGRSPW